MDEMVNRGKLLGIITFFLELGAYTYAAIYLERLILGEIWDGGDIAGLGWAGSG